VTPGANVGQKSGGAAQQGRVRESDRGAGAWPLMALPSPGYAQTRRWDDMPFRDFLNEQVTLVKKDGRRFENLPASVESNLIMTNDPRIPIEDGDSFERKIPSGITERFLIFDAGFKPEFVGFEAHYQSRVRKETEIARPQSPSHVVYNLIGPNSRVNIQSLDSSTNIVDVETSGLFEALRGTLENAIADEALRQRLRKAVDAMQTTVGTRSFSERYKDFIGLAADHVTVFAPFLPALTQLLS
jgi:hypothetical protein